MTHRQFLGDPRAREALDALHDKAVNFDVAGARVDWRVDDYRQPLPSEHPGPPQPGASWSIARDLVHDYEFADPKIIRAIYYPERPLANRDILLEGRFLGLRFRFGCRVGGVIDDHRTIEGRRTRVWGWNYRTLQGHLEMGQMDYEVWKWLDSGEIEFRIHVLSKPAPISSPLIRVGFLMFGRLMQIRFARRACRRMARLVEEELEKGATGRIVSTVERAAEGVTVAPLSEAGSSLEPSHDTARRH
jgi:uncharacterized protein (UPF0548 family)